MAIKTAGGIYIIYRQNCITKYLSGETGDHTTEKGMGGPGAKASSDPARSVAVAPAYTFTSGLGRIHLPRLKRHYSSVFKWHCISMTSFL